MRFAAPVLIWLTLLAGAATAGTVPGDDLTAAAQRALLHAAETNDPHDAVQAHARVQRAFEANPQDPRSWTLRAWEAMNAHRFTAALEMIERAHLLGPPTLISLGLESDALVELGRYDAALARVQRMLDLDPSLPALSRAAHLRFLYGDTEGAVELLRDSPVLARAGVAERAKVLLHAAELYLSLGQLDQAQATALAAERLRPGRTEALVMRARVAEARGRFADALKLYLDAQAKLPTPEHALGAWRVARRIGQRATALRQQRLLEGMARLDDIQGGLYRRVFIEFFVADPHRMHEAQRLARLDLTDRPDIYAHAWMAWTLFTAGERAAAADHATQALRLGTRDPKLRALVQLPERTAQR